eukprot:2564138-Rhodomonas_salina.3
MGGLGESKGRRRKVGAATLGGGGGKEDGGKSELWGVGGSRFMGARKEDGVSRGGLEGGPRLGAGKAGGVGMYRMSEVLRPPCAARVQRVCSACSAQRVCARRVQGVCRARVQNVCAACGECPGLTWGGLRLPGRQHGPHAVERQRCSEPVSPRPQT